MDKKNAMREYVMHTTHARKVEPGIKQSSASKNRIQDDDEDGQDLDDWLDSVIE